MPSTNDFADQQLETVILDPEQLRVHPCLESLQSMLNNAYASRHEGIFPQEGKYLRFSTLDSLAETIGTHGRCCILLRTRDGEVEPVACAMLKYFNENLDIPSSVDESDTVEEVLSNGGPAEISLASNGAATLKVKNGYDEEPAELLSISEWELTGVAVRPDPTLKKLGLAMHCTAQLEQDLFRRFTDAEEKQKSNFGKDHPAADSAAEVTFWIRATSNINAPYWERRGYEVVGETILPKGFWGSLRPFGLVTLKKHIPRRYE